MTTSPSIGIIFASGSGHTEYVVDELRTSLPSTASVSVVRAELAQPKDLLAPDVLILGSGTWNTGGQEGQLHPYMDDLLRKRAADIDLGGKRMAFISLGDNRYYFTTRCTEHFMHFLKTHNGTQLLPPLILLNEPYGQEEKVARWAKKMIALL